MRWRFLQKRPCNIVSDHSFRRNNDQWRFEPNAPLARTVAANPMSNATRRRSRLRSPRCGLLVLDKLNQFLINVNIWSAEISLQKGASMLQSGPEYWQSVFCIGSKYGCKELLARARLDSGGMVVVFVPV